MVKRLGNDRNTIICDLNYRGGFTWNGELVKMEKQTVRVWVTVDGQKIDPEDPQYRTIIGQYQNPFPGYETEFY